ncbi:MAG: stalk domain-containing protein [Defluviitaleaceae bacterium]|nr:stalk domain-containing protein [Defluviitaleaceae bacterium]
MDAQHKAKTSPFFLIKFFSLFFILTVAASVPGRAGNLPDLYNKYFDSAWAADSEEAPIKIRWQPSVMLANKNISRREEGLEMKGVLPELTSLAGALQKPVNALINEAAEKKIKSAKEAKARSIDFAYDVYSTDKIVSIVIRATITNASSRTEVVSVNFDASSEKGSSITAAGAVSANAVQLADKLLGERIRRNPENFTYGYTADLKKQAFYITNNHLVFLFDEYLLAPASEGIIPLELRLRDITSVTLSTDDYFIKPGYNVRMIPLRAVCEALGYSLVWDDYGNRMFVILGSRSVTEVAAGVNVFPRDRRSTRTLETAPEMIDGNLYVPVSFFDQVLNLTTYSISEQGNIVFSAYQE